MGAGLVMAGIGSLFGTVQLLGRNVGAAAGGYGVGALGGGLSVWGVVDLVNPPPPPVPEWEVERKVTVTPPAGTGEAKVQLLQPAGGTER